MNVTFLSAEQPDPRVPPAGLVAGVRRPPPRQAAHIDRPREFGDSDHAVSLDIGSATSSTTTRYCVPALRERSCVSKCTTCSAWPCGTPKNSAGPVLLLDERSHYAMIAVLKAAAS